LNDRLRSARNSNWTNPDVGPPNVVHVQTVDHVVYLSGEVSQGLMKQTAEDVARQTPGVTRVVNDIAVTH
jgi:osmotically-inducible protein OsmY